MATAAVVGLGSLGLAGCGGGGDEGGGGGDSRSTESSNTSESPRGVTTTDECGAVRDEPAALDPELAALADELAAATGLVEAEPYERFRVVCDALGATSALVPDAWTGRLPDPTAPPQSTVTAGPALTARVEQHPVVGFGAARFVGDAPAPSFVNDNNADGSLQSGTRSPRVGTSVMDGCTALDPVPFRLGGYTGEVQPYGDCEGGSGPRAWILAVAFPDDDGQFQAQLIGQALNTADLGAIVGTLATLRVDPDHVPGPELPPLPTVDAAG